MNVGELIGKLAELGPEAMELPVIYVDEVYARNADKPKIADTDAEGYSSDHFDGFFMESGYPNQKVVVL